MENSYKYKYRPCSITVYGKHKDILIKELSLIAYDKDKRKVIAVGTDVYEFCENVGENILILSILKNGCIANYEEAQIMFKYFINYVYKATFLSKPQIIICTPPNPTEVESIAYERAILMSGAKKVRITQESIESIIASTDVDYDIIIGITL